MKNKILIGSLSFLTLFFILLWWFKPCKPCVCCTCSIDFDSAPFAVGTTYSTKGASIATVCDFDVTIQEVNNRGIAYFSSGSVVLRLASFGSGNIFRNINSTLLFENTKTGTSTVTIDYHTQANSIDNLSVNGQLYDGKLSAAPTSLGGVSVNVSTPIAVPSGEKGIVTLTGNIKDFSIGGREFFVDNICRK